MAQLRTIHLPAVDKRVTLSAYIAAVKLAKAHPDAEFAHGFTTWWPTTGRETVKQFLDGANDRINQRAGFEQYKGYDPRCDGRVMQRLKKMRKQEAGDE